MELFLTALSIGILGSLHCVGMCGPLAIAVPVVGMVKWTYVLSRFIYHAGRVLTYALLGLVMGLAGSRLHLASFQQSLSIAIGILLLFSVVLPKYISSKMYQMPIFINFYSTIKNAIAELFHRRSFSALFSMGMLNGLLPCGFVYMAMAGAAATSNGVRGMIFLTGFGIGTLPLLLGVSLFGKIITNEVRRRMVKLIPLFSLLLSLLFILRGLNLGIPYISPQLSVNAMHENVLCH